MIAIDIDIWKHFGEDLYYHGPGYWADAYTELRLFDDLRINGKFSFANGSTSYGYNQQYLNSLFFGVTWGPDILPDPWKFEIQFFDLDRVTLGAGLFFEDREMSGMSLKINNPNWTFDIRLPGTAVLQTGGDLWSLEVFRQSSVNEVGFHGFLVRDYSRTLPSPTSPSGVVNDTTNLDPVASLFIRSKEKQFGQYRLEVAYGPKSKMAGLFGLGIQERVNCKFCYCVMAQYRYFQDDIIRDMAGNTEYNFIPYSMHDRDYDNPINAFRKKDKIQTYSVDISFKTPIGGHWYFESHNEVGQFDYEKQRDDAFVFYKESFEFCPYERYKNNCLNFYFSNRSINAISPYTIYDASQPIDLKTNVFGINGVFFL